MESKGRVFAAFALPLAVVLFAQGGSCRGGGTKGNAGTTGGAENRKASAASNASAGATTDPGGDRRGGGDVEWDEKDSVAKGAWGGEHVRLEVTEQGAEIEFDCAHGALEKIVPDRGGQFEVRGVFVRERGGPVRIGDEPKGQPARYSGKIEGKQMTLRVTLTDSDTDAGTFTLTHGKAARLFKCL